MAKYKRPKDTNELAKRIVDIAIGDIEDIDLDADKDAAAVALGRKGGLKGGVARANKLNSKRRQEIAAQAAKNRWQSR
jgi:hypothetical protein